MIKTTTYNLEHFEPGSFYSSSADYRRFSTLDYNLKTFIGIAGNGVIRGWDITVLNGKYVKVNPGCGFIKGLYTESPWFIDPDTRLPKRRNRAIADGDDIFEEIPGWSNPKSNEWTGTFYNFGGDSVYDGLVFDKLGPDGEDSNYDGSVDGVLQPNFKEPPDNYFSNPYVKAVTKESSILLLDDNAENYIYASRVSQDPKETDASFSTSGSLRLSEDSVLLAKILVKNGEVSKIEYNDVVRIKSLESVSSNITNRLLKNHNHGGSKKYDPPKIKLETDFRNSVFFGLLTPDFVFDVQSDNGFEDFFNSPVFVLVGEFETSSDLSHLHKYSVDSSGNGFTHTIVGDEIEFHYHKIENFLTSDIIKQYGSELVDHSHSISEDKNCEISPDKNIIVRINGKIVDKNNYILFSKNRMPFIVVKRNIARYKDNKYKSEFNPYPNNPNTTYSFEMSTSNPYNFIVALMQDFYKNFSSKTSYVNSETNTEQKITVRSPFGFSTALINGVDTNVEQGEDGYIVAEPTPVNTWPSGDAIGKNPTLKPINYLSYLWEESLIISKTLSNINDNYNILPFLARYIPIELVSVGKSDIISVEVLGNVEVTGQISLNNITYIDAEKFQRGIFDVSYIPFLTHSGNLTNELSLRTYPTITNNGVEFLLQPLFTSSDSQHYHKISIDKYGNGTTVGTYFNDLITIYKYNEDGNVCLVEHFHKINNFKINETISDPTNAYLKIPVGTSHFHYVTDVKQNSSSFIFSTFEDDDGSLFLGTSNGLLTAENAQFYKINIEGIIFYDKIGNLLFSMSEAINNFTIETASNVVFDPNLIPGVESELQTQGTKQKLSVIIVPSLTYTAETKVAQTNGAISNQYSPYESFAEISLINSSYIPIKNFCKYNILNPGEMDWENDDFLYAVEAQKISTLNQEATQTTVGDSKFFFVTKNNFHKETICGAIVKSDKSKILISPRKVFVSSNINGVDVWEDRIITNINYGVLRSIIKAYNGRIWISSDKGVIISSYGNFFNFWGSNNESSYDVVESKKNCILTLFNDGIYKTNGTDPSWIKVLNLVSPRKLSRNYNLDKTSIEDDHFHYIIADINGNGYLSSPYTESLEPYSEDHIHNINEWTVTKINDHEHEIQSSIFCKTKYGNIFWSLDSGETWSELTEVPSEYGENDLFIAAFDKVFVSTENGLFSFSLSEREWKRTIVGDVVCSLSFAYNLNKIIVGSSNSIYFSYDGENFTKTSLPYSGSHPKVYLDSREIKTPVIFNNNKNSFIIRENDLLSNNLEVSTNKDEWIAPKWNSNINYDIFLNGNKVNSSEDKKDFPYVNNNSGVVDFSITTSLSSSVTYGDTKIVVKDATGFNSGDEIEIIFFDSKLGLTRVFKNKVLSTNLAANSIEIEDAIFFELSEGSVVRKLFNLTGDNIVEIQKKEMGIGNAGKKLHSEIEDSFSVASADMPFQLSNTYLNNLSQLSLFLKYGFQNIDNYYQNWNTYMMRYQRNLGEPNYIGNFIDVEQSRFQTGIGLSLDGNIISSSQINVVRFGRQDFEKIVMVGTSRGLFVGVPSTNFNNNWFFVPNNIYGSVRDIINLKDNKMLVCGSNGAYVNEDSQLTTWSSLLASTETNPAYFSRYRWENAKFNTMGWWDQWQDDINLLDQDIKNDIIVGGKNFVVVSHDSGDSWEFAAITDIFSQSKSILEYNANCFLPLTNGAALLGANDAKFSKQEYIYKIVNNVATMAVQKNAIRNVVFETQGIGDNWNNEIFNFREYLVLITNVLTTDYGNTMLTIDSQNNNHLPHNSLIGSFITINNKQWRIVSNSSQSIIIYGIEASQNIKKNDTGIIGAIKINGLSECDGGILLMLTSSGLFYDKNTYYRSKETSFDGIITGVNKEATVLSVDTSGFVISTLSTTNSLTNESQTELICALNKNVDTNELVGQNITFVSNITPALYILSPQSNEEINSTSVTITTMVQSFGLGVSGQIGLKIDNATTQYTTNSVITINNLSYGIHKLNVFLTDMFKNKLGTSGTEKTIYFTTSPTSQTPYINIDYPSSGESIKSASFYALANTVNFNTAIDGFLAYLIDNQTTPTRLDYPGSDNYKILINGLSSGSHTLKLLLLDTGGNEIGISSTVQFNLSAEFPSIFLTYPTATAPVITKDFSVSYTVNNFSVPSNGRVKIEMDGKLIGYSNDAFGYSLTNVQDGNHTIKVTLVDTASQIILGSYSSDTTNFIVNSQIFTTPSITIISPKNGDVVQSGQNIDLYFSVSNFSIPGQGSVAIYVNNTLFSTVNSTDPLAIPMTNDGTYQIDAYLIDSNGQKLTNSQAKSSISILSSDQVTTQNVTLVEQESLTATTTITTTPVVQSIVSPTTSATVEQTDKTGMSKSFKILSNSASSATGTIVIKTEGLIGQENIGSLFKVIGSNSILYVSYSHPVVDHEFDGGLAYIVYDETQTKVYTVKEQTGNKIELSATIDPNVGATTTTEDDGSISQTNDVSPGQKIALVPQNKNVKLGVNFTGNWNENDLASRYITVEDIPGIQIPIISNTSKTIDVNMVVYPNWIQKGMPFKISSPVFVPMTSFNFKRTSSNLNHYHDVSLLNSKLSGEIVSIYFNNTAYITIYTKNTINCSLPLIQNNPFLLDGAPIIFYKGNNTSIIYTETAYAVYSDRIVVKVANIQSNWNINGSNPLGIDSTFLWEINGSFYGETSKTYYYNFNKYKTKLTENLNIGDSVIKVVNSYKFKVGDDVQIYDNQNHVLVTSVEEIIDDETIKIHDISTCDFETTNDSQIVIKVNDEIMGEKYHISSSSSSDEMNTFDHYHIIKDGEINTARVESLFNGGYPIYHNHYVTNLIENPSNIIKQGDTGQIVISGNSPNLYVTKDDGLKWSILVNLKQINKNIQSVTSIDTDTDLDLVIGTDIGLIIKEGLINDQIAPLEYPLTEEFLPSSSSSSSTSSVSSSSSTSSQSTESSQSSSQSSSSISSSSS